MKRDRNTFFSNYSTSQQSYIPQPQMPNMQMQNMQTQSMQMPTNQQFGPYQAANSESSFYAGPSPQTSSELENRLTKIERQINRLDSRITRLENTAKVDIDETNYSNMYML